MSWATAACLTLDGCFAHHRSRIWSESPRFARRNTGHQKKKKNILGETMRSEVRTMKTRVFWKNDSHKTPRFVPAKHTPSKQCSRNLTDVSTGVLHTPCMLSERISKELYPETHQWIGSPGRRRTSAGSTGERTPPASSARGRGRQRGTGRGGSLLAHRRSLSAEGMRVSLSATSCKTKHSLTFK